MSNAQCRVAVFSRNPQSRPQLDRPFMPANSPCPCCSGQSYQDCCLPVHQGAVACSPEALMRSRFSAHALGLMDYILASWAAPVRDQVDRPALQHWLDTARFGRLVVRCAQADAVEFECWYQQDGQLHQLHDLSHFVQQAGHWRYARSSAPKLPATHIGRNDPCPCGSGQKLKKCCSRVQHGA